MYASSNGQRRNRLRYLRYKMRRGFAVLLRNGDQGRPRHDKYMASPFNSVSYLAGFSTAAVGGLAGAAGRAGFIQQEWTRALNASVAFWSFWSMAP